MTKSGQWLPGEGTLKSLYGSNAEEARQKAEALAERGENWNRNPNEAASSLYGAMTEKEGEAAKMAEREEWIKAHPEEFAMAEGDRLRREAKAEAEADRIWLEKYEADNAAQRARDKETRELALEWEAKNRQRVMGGR